MSGKPLLIIVPLCLAVFMTGCGSSGIEFREREETAELIPPAQDYMEELLAEHFGSPTASVAWEKLPINYHAATATVDEAGESGSVTLANIGRTLPINEGQQILWFVDGSAHSGQVAGFDEDLNALTVSPPAGADQNWAPPAPGARLTIGPGETLQQGRLLYAEHCQHCHGVTGDGNGPTAEYLEPRPRDYRLGKFKFTSTSTVRKAQRDDLARIIEEGIPGTYMPSFKLLTEEESAAIVEYVRWLAMRGETELRRIEILTLDFRAADAETQEELDEMIQEFAEAKEDDFPNDFADETEQIADSWRVAQEESSVVLPKTPRTPSSPESIAKGREIYLSATAKCVTCHGESGKGDGPQTMQVAKDASGQNYPVPGLHDDWGRLIEPRNLTTGIYRGGRRPLDLYRRIHSGIKGTPMTGFGTSLSDEQIWDLVNYVMSIPFEDRAPGEGPFVPSESAPEATVAKSE
ncbi:MAG: cytochrome c [Planctomycetota bacterium]|nr:MAG: cytochrome c [Planctomycetota bacterium]REJ93264.1 MAG: cytochrome c [Planctomycetota bacterium]REK22555.1 MAG: cytochrome c [Planctomycetota bacterium]REK36023.1 MAG: cytochrome c [Planctomycetota bacterium]